MISATCMNIKNVSLCEKVLFHLYEILEMAKRGWNEAGVESGEDCLHRDTEEFEG